MVYLLRNINGRSGFWKKKQTVEGRPWTLSLDRRKQEEILDLLPASPCMLLGMNRHSAIQKRNTHKIIFNWQAEPINWIQLVRIHGNNRRWTAVSKVSGAGWRCVCEPLWGMAWTCRARREIQRPELSVLRSLSRVHYELELWGFAWAHELESCLLL